MDFRQLQFFLAIVDEGGLNKAAAKVFVSPSAISRKIRLLEEELGEHVFRRARNQLILTPAGKLLLHNTRLIFRHAKLATTEIRQIAGLQRGEVSIGAGWWDCAHLLPPVLMKFRERYPEIELRVSAGSPDEILPQVRDGRIDVGVLGLLEEDHEKDLLITKLCSEELVVAVSRDHPWAKRTTVAAAELTNFPFIALGKQSPRVRRLVDTIFHELGVTPRIAMELPMFTTIRPLVEINLGISILPLSLVLSEGRSKPLHFVRIREKRIQREIGVVHLRTDFLPRAVSAIIRFLKQEVGGVKGTPMYSSGQ